MSKVVIFNESADELNLCYRVDGKNRYQFFTTGINIIDADLWDNISQSASQKILTHVLSLFETATKVISDKGVIDISLLSENDALIVVSCTHNSNTLRSFKSRESKGKARTHVLNALDHKRNVLRKSR